MPKPLLNQQRSRLLVALFVVLASLYMMTYSARIESGDTHRFVDAVSSFADYGDFYLDLSTWQFPPETFDAHLKFPLQTGDVEPLQVIVAVPLYLLAKITPGIGLVQTIYLFNVLVCAVAGCVLFLYGLALGYRERTAVLATLAFGVGTAIFPYSKSFFREPLALLTLLICALLFERLRAVNYRSLPLVIAVTVALLALLLAKASTLFALPALLVIGVPTIRSGQFRRVLFAVVLVVALVIGIIALLSAVSLFGERYNLLRVLNRDWSAYLATALQAYLLSVGGSIWGTSPIVLLAVPGILMLVRRRQWRYPLAIVLLVLVFSASYAALNDRHWFGGLSWPPRFLLPLLPFLIIGALPAIERAETQLRWALVGAALMIYSVWVQLSGITLDWQVYSSLLPPEAHGLMEWGGGLNDLRYLRWVLIPQQWRSVPLDIAWVVIHAEGFILAFAGLAVAAGVWITRSLRTKAGRAILVLPVLLIGLVGAGEHVLYATDPRYLATDDSLYAMLPILEAETQPADVVLLSSPRYEPFFLASGKLFHAGRMVTLPLQPGEQPSPEQQPLIRSDNPMLLLTTDTIQLIYNLAATHDRLWVLVDGGPDLPWSVRPVERFMSAHYYPIRTLETGPITRLIEYSTISAPNMFAYREPDHPTDLTFDTHIHLIGFDLPQGTAYHAGDVLALTTAWKTDRMLDRNITIGLYLRDSNGNAVAQVDEQPGAGFYPTSQWQPDVPIWDNRAIRLPSDLPAGRYQVWIKLYDFNDDLSVHDLTVTSGNKLDDSIGILPFQIQVS